MDSEPQQIEETPNLHQDSKPADPDDIIKFHVAELFNQKELNYLSIDWNKTGDT